MSSSRDRFLRQHVSLTRRYFLRFGAVGIAAMRTVPLYGADHEWPEQLQHAIDQLEPWLTPQDDFRDVSRGNPKPHSLDLETREQVGMTRETWKLQVVSDPDQPADLKNPLSTQRGNAFDFAQLMELARTKAVRFPKVMTCLNIGCPLGNGIWEGVPLRDVVWMTRPQKNLRRVFYHGYHNDKPEQMFRSSLPVGRVLEDPFDLPPVILCYKLNGHYLSPQRGGPVRVVVPEAYGFKSIKWLSHVYLSNIASANDTYASQNNDVDSPLKTFCATLSVPNKVKPHQPIAITGYSQVGISGLAKVQVWIQKKGEPFPSEDEYFQTAPWIDASILPPPDRWGGQLADNKIPTPTVGFDAATGQPGSWPIRFSKAHWAILHRGLDQGDYVLRCRTIDEKGHPQPLPRPFRKSGRAAIESVRIRVTS